MAGTGTIGIKGQRMFEDDSYIVLWSKGLFGMYFPLLSSFYVFFKHDQSAVKVTSSERIFLLAVMKEWENRGLPARALRETQFLHDFSDAVGSRGKARWTVFFRQGNPRLTAANYC